VKTNRESAVLQVTSYVVQVSRRCSLRTTRRRYHRVTGRRTSSFRPSAASSRSASATPDSSVSVPTWWPQRRPHGWRCLPTWFRWPSEECTPSVSTLVAR